MLLQPLALFRKLKLIHRILILQILLLVPFVQLLLHHNQSVSALQSENRLFSQGVEKVRQLSLLQEHIAQYRGLHHGEQQRSRPARSETTELLKELHQNIDSEIASLSDATLPTLNPHLIEIIQTQWQALAHSSNSHKADHFSGYTRLISQVHHLIKQVSTVSSPKLNPEHPELLKIYSLSTHTIAALKEQMGQLRGITYGALQSGQDLTSNQQFQVLLPITLSKIATYRALVRDQLVGIYQYSPELYRESFSLFSDYSIELAALFELLNWELENTSDDSSSLQLFQSPDAFFQQVSFQIELLDQLIQNLFAHIEQHLAEEQQQLILEHNRHLLLLVLILITALLSLVWVLYDNNRGNLQLRSYLQQKDPLQLNNMETGDHLSNLDHEHLQIWQAYHHLEQHLEHETARLLTLKQGVDRAAMIMITDLEGAILYVNESLIDRTGYSEAELLGSKPSILKSGETSRETYQRLWKSILAGKIWKNQLANRSRSGELYWVEETIVPLLDDNDEVQEFFAIHVEITTQMIAEQRLEGEVKELKALQSVTTEHQNQQLDSDFTVTSQMEEDNSLLPVEPQNEPIRVLAVDDEKAILDSYRVLLREDDSEAVDQLGSLLEGSSITSEYTPPFILECTTSGEIAVEKLRSAMNRGKPYQVVYLDMLMPGGWDGLKTAKEILRIDPMVRIIVISAWSDHKPAELKPVLGEHFIYLKKPFSREELIQLTHYMAEDWRRTQQLTQSKESLSQIMLDLTESNRQRQHELDSQRIYQMILVTLSTSAPLFSGDRQSGYNEITQATLEALGVDRVTLWRLEEEEGEQILIADDCYNVKEQQHHSGARQYTRDYQEFWNQIEHRQVVRIDDTAPLLESLSQPSNYFNEHDIQSLMISPIFYNNEQTGVITAEVQTESRVWKLEEATFLSYVSNLVPTIEISAARKDAETRAENANKAKDDFLATMSHELRTPLSSMIGYGDILSESPLNHDQQDLVCTIQLAGKTLLALVNDILDISKIEAGKFELDHAPFSLETLLHEMDMMFSPKATLNQIDFKIEQSGPLPSTQLAGDERRIIQILINLIGNAIKFTNDGSVSLTLSQERDSITEDPQRGLFHFAVKDSGIGIAADVMDRLFRPFEQADGTISRTFGGTGLGLYISRVLAHMMEGEIQLQSIEGEGSTFTLSIPLEITDLPLPDSATHTIQKTERGNIRLKGKVLIVEDTAELQQLEKRLVEATGATVELASDGEEALAMGLGGSYDLILMDMQMPKMDGITATQLLRNSSVTTPIVALTANVMQKHRDEFNSAGCNDFLSKPIDQAALKKVLSTYLEEGELSVITPDTNQMPLSDELTALFVERLIESEQQINQFFEQQAWAQLRQVIHTLKGSGSSFGHPEITELSRSVEQLLIQENHSALDDALNQLIKVIQTAQSAS